MRQQVSKRMRSIAVFAIGAIGVIAGACTDKAGVSDPGVGALVVTTTTTGPQQFMPYSPYALRLDALSPGQIAVNGRWLGLGLTAGRHSVALDISSSSSGGVCTLAPANQVAVTVVANDTARVAFTVSCKSPYPMMQVVLRTTGADVPVSYSVYVDSAVQRYPLRLFANSDQTIILYPNLNLASPRSAIVLLTGIASNCQLDGTARREVTVTNGDTTKVSYDVSCTAIPTVTGFPFEDPVGDTLPSPAGYPLSAPPAVDLRRVDGRFAGDTVVAVFRFAGPVRSLIDSSRSVLGVVEFDLDENVSTGTSGIVNDFLGTSTLGVEARLSIPPDSQAFVYRGTGAGVKVPSIRDADSIVVRLPLSVLGGTGTFRWGMVFGNAWRMTDGGPNGAVWRVLRPADVILYGDRR